MNRFKKIERRILNTVDEIRRGENSLYDIATLCLKLLDEKQAYAEAIGMQPEDIESHIDNTFLCDFNITVLELGAIIQVFPKREQWDKPLVRLYEDAVAVVSASEKKEREHKPSRKSVKVAEYERVIGELDSAKAEIQHVRDESLAMRDEAAEMRDRIHELEQENAMLRGRIQELERLVRREHALV